MSFKIERITGNQPITLLRLCGHVQAEHVSTIQDLIAIENGSVSFDLKDVTLTDRNVASYLARCELRGIGLINCPAFIREWVSKERSH